MPYKMTRLDRAWAVLPCACLFDDRTAVPLLDVFKEWPAGQILVVRDVNTSRLRFFASSGDMRTSIGFRREAFHTQTMKIIGEYEVVNVVTYKTVDGKPVLQYANTVGLESKAPVYCFK